MQRIISTRTFWIKAALTALVLAGAALHSAQAQTSGTNFVLTTASFQITFSKAWSLVYPPTFLGSGGGLGGLAYVGDTAGQSLPNQDSLALTYSKILGGHLKAAGSSDTTLGKYQVRRQEFSYDSLPRLDSMINAGAAKLGFPISVKHKNGSFRVYVLLSDGFVFTAAGLNALPNATPPYVDIEAAIPTLVFHSGAGVRFVTNAPQSDLWIRGGRLGGAWLRAHAVLAVECFDVAGAWLGEAKPMGGEWLLPARGRALWVRVRAGDGLYRVLPVPPSR